jgi:septum formation protein
MLVLASSSPRRQELLRTAGISFSVQPADVDETPLAGESARDCAERLAKEKGIKVWRMRPQDLVLGADTVVVVENEILGKPVDGADAERMLRLLSGRQHEVITGVSLIRPKESQKNPTPTHIRIASETTIVTMSQLSERDIRDYIATGEPMDKAGAYAIQGIASRWIPRIEGDYSNVVGLPIALVYRMLREQ